MLRGDSEPRVGKRAGSVIPEVRALAADPETSLLGRVYGHSSSKPEMGCGEAEEWAERNVQ